MPEVIFLANHYESKDGFSVNEHLERLLLKELEKNTRDDFVMLFKNRSIMSTTQPEALYMKISTSSAFKYFFG